MRKAALVLALLAAGCAPDAPGRPRLARPGDPAPELRLPKLINSPLEEVRGLSDLKGKAVVLEFWGSWCENCPGPLAGLSALAERFSGQPVAFIAVTDEPERDVREYLKKNPSAAWFAAGAGPELFRSYRVYGRPYAALIAANGTLAALKADGAVGEDEVASLLRNSFLPAPSAQGRAQPAGPGDVLAEFYIAEARAYGGLGSFGADSLKASGMQLQYALNFIFGRADRVEVKPAARAAMDAYYDMRLQFPKGRGERHRKEFFLRGLETALGLKVKESLKDAEVWVMKTAPGGPANVKKSGGSGSVRFEGPRCVVDSGSFSVLAEALASRMGEPVKDETGLQGGYSYVFDFKEGDSKAFNAQLRAQLGLRLERKLRKLRVLEVSRPEP